MVLRNQMSKVFEMRAILKRERKHKDLHCTEFKYITNWEYYVLVDNAQLNACPSMKEMVEQKAQAVLNKELYGPITEDLQKIRGLARGIRPRDYVNEVRLWELEVAIEQALEKLHD